MRYYLWVLPNPTHAAKLAAQIRDLSRIYRTPLFIPHITVASGNQPYRFSSFDAPKVRLLPVETKNEEKQALYYPVSLTPNLLAIQTFYAPHKRYYTPHLSLIYGTFSVARRAEWKQKCPVYTEEILFRHLCLVQGDADVNNWKILETWELPHNDKTY
ncbi:MAG: hypothetical protein VX278_04490 [Myxococcota bacterium]|nr:hypothetical protein [Myxococcota bacterium]